MAPRKKNNAGLSIPSTPASKKSSTHPADSKAVERHHVDIVWGVSAPEGEAAPLTENVLALAQVKRDIIKEFDPVLPPYYAERPLLEGIIPSEKLELYSFLQRELLQPVEVPLVLKTRNIQGQTHVYLSTAASGHLQLSTVRWVLDLLVRRTESMLPKEVVNDLLLNFESAGDLFGETASDTTSRMWAAARDKYLINNVFLPVVRAYGQTMRYALSSYGLTLADIESIVAFVDRVVAMKEGVLTSAQSVAVLSMIERFHDELTQNAADFISTMLETTSTNLAIQEVVTLPLYKAISIYSAMQSNTGDISALILDILDSSQDFTFSHPLGHLERRTSLRDLAGVPVLVDYHWSALSPRSGSVAMGMIKKWIAPDLSANTHADLFTSVLRSIMTRLDSLAATAVPGQKLLSNERAAIEEKRTAAALWLQHATSFLQEPPEAYMQRMEQFVAAITVPYVVRDILTGRQASGSSILSQLNTVARLELAPTSLFVLNVAMTVRRDYKQSLQRMIGAFATGMARDLIKKAFEAGSSLMSSVLKDEGYPAIEGFSVIKTGFSKIIKETVVRYEGTGEKYILVPRREGAQHGMTAKKYYVIPEMAPHLTDPVLRFLHDKRMTNALRVSCSYVGAMEAQVKNLLVSPDEFRAAAPSTELSRYFRLSFVPAEEVAERYDEDAIDRTLQLHDDNETCVALEVDRIISVHRMDLPVADTLRQQTRRYVISDNPIMLQKERAFFGLALEPGDVVVYRVYTDTVGLQEEAVEIVTPTDDMPDPRMVMYVDKNSDIQKRKASASEKLATMLSKLVYEDEMHVEQHGSAVPGAPGASGSDPKGGNEDGQSLESYVQF